MRLVIVEDDSILQENLSRLLSGEREIAVLGAFGLAEEALQNLKRLAPDILLVDLGLPGMSGLELIRRVKAEFPEVEIMVHTVFEDKENVFSAIKAGASAYILKGSSPRELVEAIHNLYQGGAPMSPKIARRLIAEFQTAGIEEQYLLSNREKEIVKGIEKGFSYKELATELNISPHTVHTHIKNVYEKLQVKNRQDALIKARRKGII